VACSLLVAATGCVDDDLAAGCESSEIPFTDGHDIVVEGDPWSGYALFRDSGLLDASDYKLIYVEQLCQDVRARDLADGDADFIVTTLDQYLLNKPDGTIVGVVDQSQGADALVLNTVQHQYLNGTDNLPELVHDYERDHKKPVLAYTGNSPSEMLLNELANTTEELHLGDFELVSVTSSGDALQMLRDLDAQVAILWEPDTSTAQAEGYTVALSSKDAPDAIVDVLVASDKVLDHDPESVAALVTSFYEAMDDYLADAAGRSQLESLIAEDGALTAEQAGSVLDGIKFYGSAEADAFMNEDLFPLDQPRLDSSMRSIAALLGLLHPEVTLHDVHVDGSFVHEVNR
jgi:ABC-type nitrate/sulfonate/bicarbonate transport system substrate-binding protein